METKGIIKSGFVKAFIAKYFEDKIYSFYPDKVRLLYVLCSTDLEKQQVTEKQIEIIKNEIQKLGYEDLSFAYLSSCKPDSGVNYIKPENRFDEWLEIFKESFIDNMHSFTPILEVCERLKNEPSIDDLETEFWQYYPVNQKPKIDNLSFIIQREYELMDIIEHIIYEFKKNKCWEFDFEELKQFDEISKPIEMLFNISELFVQLNRLEMFKDFLLPPKQSETKGAKLTYRQQALIIVYNGGQIYRSDTGLYKHRELQIASNRIAEPQNTKAYNDFVNDLKIAIQNLTDAAKNRAIDELKLYENKFKDTFVKTK